jgi:uncharacterized lipoprotein YddW (UPF0748 family)
MKSMRAFCTAILLSASMAMAADPPEFRAVYVASFDTNTQAKCDNVIADMLAGNLNQLFVQVRARGDASYFPNREDSTYPNTEPRGQLYALSPSDLDVLQYYIDRLHAVNPKIEVHAWLTTYNCWNQSAAPASSSHVLNQHPEWVTENAAGTTFTYNALGNTDVPLDPGIPAVQDYLYNVFTDIVRNYDIDGIHFDYIRLLDTDSGYDPVAKARFLADTGWNYDTQNTGGQLDEVYEAWRRDQVSKLVQRVHTQTMLEKPWVEVSAFLVNFEDSVENLAQGYNWWVANDAIDVLHPGCYSSTVAGTAADWDFYVSKLALNGDQNKRPLICAVGSYLFTTAPTNDPIRNQQSVTTLRGNARVPDGFNFFEIDSLFNNSVTTPTDQMAQDLFNLGNPMDEDAPLPTVAHKVALGEETTPPLAPASASVSLVSGAPRVNFSRPAAAGDGDLPVHYRLYRDDALPVDLHYSNMVMEWWDLASTRTSFSYDDVAAPVGSLYWTVVAYDNWNNEASATVGPLAFTGSEVIVESHDSAGVITTAPNGYTQSSGFSNSTAKSTAAGLSGLNTEYSTNGALTASYTITPNLPVAGIYDIYITTPSASSVDAANSQYSVTHASGTSTGSIALTDANTGNKWALLLGNVSFNAGTGGSVTISEGSPQVNRFYADAVKFVRQTSPTPKEAKPAVSAAASAVTELIVDSTPQALNYDDFGSATAWISVASPTGFHNNNARVFEAADFPFDQVAVWLVDLPSAGQWAIDGYVRSNSTYATGAQYRFVDGGGTVRSVSTTQRAGTSGWNINVDGVADGSAYNFNKGHVYITLYGNTGGAQDVIADALRLRKVSSGLEGWMLLEEGEAR